LVGVAVKITLIPAHIVLPGLAAILTDGMTTPVTVIVMVFDVAVATVIQFALLVMIQVIISPFTKAAFVYVLLFVPTFVPFSFH
jgi:hypothetical protein